MSDNKPGMVQRNLESGGNLYINKWWTGLYKNRSPLYTPVSALGIQLIARQDALWDGLNMMITPQFSLRRSYGFTKASSVAFSSSEWPLTFFSFQTLDGTIHPIADTQTKVYKFDSGSKTSIYTKANGAVQSSFNSVANMMYWCDGQNANKWDGTTITQMGITPPPDAPTLAYTASGTLLPTIGYQYGYCYKNPNTGHVSTMSPASANTGPLNNKLTTESRITAPVTATSMTSNVITVTAANNFEPGQSVTFSALGASTFLNGHTVIVSATGLSSSTFEATGFTHADYSSVAETKGNAVMTVSVPNATPYQYTVVNAATFLGDGGVTYANSSSALAVVNSSPTTGQYSVSAGVYTFAAADAGAPVDITYSYALANSTGINIVVRGDGTADPQATLIDIFRTDDGGAEYFFLAEINNPGATTWSYTDSTLDSGLNDLIIAPVADFNNPPPAGMSLLVWYAGRLWGASGNTLYFSAGPDATNGVGQECWPPGNNYTLPGNITALAATSAGLIIWTKDDAYVTLGSNSSNFTTPQIWQSNWGVANQNCVTQDGDNLFIFTTKGQIYNYGANGLQEIGFLLEAQFAAMTPSNVYIAIHRSGEDEGCFISDGSANIYRYSQVASAWDTVMQPPGGCGAIMSMELTTENWRLLMGRPTASGYILQRDLNTFSVDGTNYPCWATVGSLTVAPPRQVANIESVLAQFNAVGTYPTISVLLNEIADTGKLPATFVVLPNPVPDPPQLAASQTIWTRRHDFKAAQTPLPGHVQHMQIKIIFPSEAQPNEVLGLGLAHKEM